MPEVADFDKVAIYTVSQKKSHFNLKWLLFSGSRCSSVRISLIATYISEIRSTLPSLSVCVCALTVTIVSDCDKTCHRSPAQPKTKKTFLLRSKFNKWLLYYFHRIYDTGVREVHFQLQLFSNVACRLIITIVIYLRTSYK